MDTAHRLRVTSDPAALLFECEDGCGRRLAVDRTTGRLSVLAKGDQLAQHYGANGGVDLRPTGLDNA